MSLDTVSVQVWSIDTVDGNEEGQVERCHADELGVVKDRCEAWTEGPRRPED